MPADDQQATRRRRSSVIGRRARPDGAVQLAQPAPGAPRDDQGSRRRWPGRRRAGPRRRRAAPSSVPIAQLRERRVEASLVAQGDAQRLVGRGQLRRVGGAPDAPLVSDLLGPDGVRRTRERAGRPPCTAPVRAVAFTGLARATSVGRTDRSSSARRILVRLSEDRPWRNPLTRPTRARGHLPLAPLAAEPVRTLVAGARSTTGTADLDEETSRVQLELVLKAFGKDGVGGLPPTPGGARTSSYLVPPGAGHGPVAGRAAAATSFFDERRDTYRGGGRVSRRAGRRPAHVRAAGAGQGRQTRRPRSPSARSTRSLGAGAVRPGPHRPRRGPRHRQDVPRHRARAAARQGPVARRSARTPRLERDIRVSVVDTGWYAGGRGQPGEPLARRHRRTIEGDLETVNPTAIHPYAGHGTFVAGHHPVPRPGHHDRDRGRPHQGRRGLRVGHHQGAQRGDDGPGQADSSSRSRRARTPARTSG